MKKKYATAPILLALSLSLCACNVSLQPASTPVNVPIQTPAISQPITPTAPIATPNAGNEGDLIPDSSPIATESVMPTDDVVGEPTSKTHTVYYPEGSTEETANYILTYTVPNFGSSAFSKALNRFTDELLDRVAEERLPFADRGEGEAAPSTSVTYTYSFEGGYHNIYFTESVSFGKEVEALPYTLVLNASGEEASLYTATYNYELLDLVTQQIYNSVLDTPDKFYGDISEGDIRSSLDLYNGFLVQPDGYTLLLRPGTIAPKERGVLRFTIPAASLYSFAVGDALSVSEYSVLQPALRALAIAAAPNYESFSNGEPGAYLASAFLSGLLAPKDATGYFYELTLNEYENAFASYFTGDLPKDISNMGDGTIFLDNDMVRLPLRPEAAYSFRIDNAVREANNLTLYGMLLFGVPGSANAGELASVSLVLEKTDSTEIGWRFVELQII